MCRTVLVALVIFALGCGRSSLTDELGVWPGLDDDGGLGPIEMADGAAITDSWSSYDSTYVPPYDAYTPPYRDAYTPPYYDAYVRPNDDASNYMPDGGCGPSTCDGCCQADGSCLPLNGG